MKEQEEKMAEKGKTELEEIRLNKYISEAGICSRREADRLIEAGKVTVDGMTGTMGMKVKKGQKVMVDGLTAAKEKEVILLAVNKPSGVVCTTEKKWGDKTLEELVNYPKRVFSVGRLDKDSEGLILMTNQGDILNKMMKAGNYHEKEYVVTVDKKVTPDFLRKMSEGVLLKELEITTRPCKVELAGENRFRIVLTQGLNRQIRRMCECFGYHVIKLVRIRIMNVELGKLPGGQYRHLTRQEINTLMSSLEKSKNNTERKYQKDSRKMDSGKADALKDHNSGENYSRDEKSRAAKQGNGRKKSDRNSGYRAGEGRPGQRGTARWSGNDQGRPGQSGTAQGNRNQGRPGQRGTAPGSRGSQGRAGQSGTVQGGRSQGRAVQNRTSRKRT